jgi:hypothetical protein
MGTPFLQARWFTPCPVRAISLVVIHDMEMPEKGDTAEACAKMFSTTDRKASAHFTVDTDSVVQCVRLMDVAWHAPGANHQGIGIEHAGYAAQTARDWADDYSEKMLHVSAALTADLCKQFNLPHAFVDEDGLLAGHRGFTTHYEVSRAWHLSDHTDPGVNFPMTHYLDLVHAAAGPTPIPQEVRPVVNAPVVSVLSHPSWNGGYAEVGSDGGVFSWAAPNFGSTGSTKLNSPIVAGAVTPSGQGYWLVASDGGVFSFGDAGFHGSMGGTALNKPVVGIVGTPSGQGYWLVGSDGGIFSFGDAAYRGSVEFRG